MRSLNVLTGYCELFLFSSPENVERKRQKLKHREVFSCCATTNTVTVRVTLHVDSINPFYKRTLFI